MKQLRKLRNLTQGEVADAIGVTRTAYTNYENGKRNPRLETLRRLAYFFDVPIPYLLGESTSENPFTKRNKIPLLGSVPAGIPIEAIEDVEDYIDVYPRFVKHGELFALRVQGDSMEPEVRSGDIVIVEKQDFINSGDIAVIRINGEDVTVKRVKVNGNGLMLIPSNPAYDPLFFTPDQIAELPITIIGKVIEVRRRL